LIDKIKANLSWEYPFEAVAKIPAKNSVSSLSHSEDEFKTFDYTPDMEKFSAGAVDYDPMTTGSATHLLIQKLDLSAAIDLAAIEDKKNELTNARLISPEAAKRIDTDSISKFFASPLGSEALDSANSIFREWPFTIAIPAVEIYPELSVDADEKIIIQGIIDMLIKTPDGAVVIDFKTDRIASVQAGERAQRYRKQINYYSRAVREVLKTPVTAAYIYFLGPALAIDIPQG